MQVLKCINSFGYNQPKYINYVKLYNHDFSVYVKYFEQKHANI